MAKTVLHIIDTTGPGGAETVFTQLAAESERQGYRVLALIRGNGWVSSELQRLGIMPIVEDCKGGLNFRFLRFLIELIRKEKVDVIQSHLLGSNVYASLAGFFTARPVVSTFHGFVDINNKERFAWAKFFSIRLGSKKIIAVTEQIKSMLRVTSGFGENSLQVISNGIDVKLFNAKDNYQLVSPDKIKIACLGNVRPAKNYPLAIKAIYELVGQGYEVELHIAGDDKNKLAETCKGLAAELKVSDKIHWLGFCQQPSEYLKGSDIFLLCSSSEGHPLALTQAMSAGLPIVATRCGIENILQEGKTALLAENESVQSLVDQLKRFISDSALREACGLQAAKEARLHWSKESMFEQYFSLYASLV